MMVQCIKAILILVPMLAILPSCQKKTSPFDEKKQYLRVNIHTEPPTLDARKATDTSSIAVINMCFEGLMKRTKDGRIEPAIAHKVEISDDNLTYIFHLREAKWWDGMPVTAYDFEDTWKTILNPSFPSGFANDLYIIKNGKNVKNQKLGLELLGVKALDAKTLKVELEHPIPYFLDLTATHSYAAVPKHITSQYPNWADDSGPHFVGNGPYKIERWRHHNCILMKKNPLYWDQDVVTLKEIHMSIIEDETTELNMFESGELDWAGSPLSALPTDALQALADDNRLETYPVSGTYYYIFNVTAPPFNNLNLRKAFTLAIDRQSIIDNITQSKQSPALSYIPPTMWEVVAHFEDNQIEEARRLFNLALDEMGITKNELESITLTYNTLSAHHKIAQAIQEQWYRAFGIRVRLANKEWKVFLDELAHKQFQIARMGGIASFGDPATFFDLYRYPESSNNYSGWSNQAFTYLIEQAEKTADPKKREALLRDAEKIFMAEMPIAPIYYYTGTYIKKHYVKGVNLSNLSEADFKFAFLEMQ